MSHGADLIYWSTHQGGQDPAAAIATLKEGKIQPVDKKLMALIKAGVSVRLAKSNNRYVLDVGFIGGGQEIGTLEEQTNGRQERPESILESVAPVVTVEGTQTNPTQNTVDAENERLKRIAEMNQVKPISPARMAAYLEACK